MSKRWLPLIAVIIIAAFTIGLRLGTTTGQNQNQDNNQNPQTARRANTTIAVINADTGTLIDGERLNYSSAIIATLGEGFVLVSPAMAQTGFSAGTYAAIITFPSHVSTRILSFNANQPERVQLEFQINPDLPERDFLETYITITELQLAINTTLASTYVSSILRQFHEAQDQIDGVFNNNLADLMALENLTLSDFTAQLNLDEVPQIPLNPRELDTHFYMGQVASFAEEVANWYLHSYAMASDQFLWMREGLFALTENFPEQEEQWLSMLEIWTNYSVQYGELLEIYAIYVRGHDEELFAWFLENEDWNEALAGFQHDMIFWHDFSTRWFEGGEAWHEEYMAYLRSVIEFQDALAVFHNELDFNVDLLMDDMTHWLDYLRDYEDDLYLLFLEFLDAIDNVNWQSELTNDFMEDLTHWHTSLDENRDLLIAWLEELNDQQLLMNLWQDELDDNQTEVQRAIDLFLAQLYTLPIIPEEIPLYDYWDAIIIPEPVPTSNATPPPSIPVDGYGLGWGSVSAPLRPITGPSLVFPIIIEPTPAPSSPVGLPPTPAPPSPIDADTAPAPTPAPYAPLFPPPTPAPYSPHITPPPPADPQMITYPGPPPNPAGLDPDADHAALLQWHTQASIWYGQLNGWHTMLDGWHTGLDRWAHGYDGQTGLNCWYSQLSTWYFGLDAWAYGTDGLFYWHGQIYNWYSNLKDLAEKLDTWYEDLNSWHWDLDIWTGDVVLWHGDLLSWHYNQSNWHNQLNSLSTQLDNNNNLLITWYMQLNASIDEWHDYINMANYYLDEWRDDLQGFHGVMSYFHTFVSESQAGLQYWRDNLLDLSYIKYNWGNELHQHSYDMNEWHSLFISLNEELPMLPDYSFLQHLDIPDEADTGISSALDPMEMIELLAWDEDLFSPSPYDGAHILDAFAVNFPLHSAAIHEPLGLESPPEYIGAQHPDAVRERFMMMAQEPFNPLVGPPPRPDDFWHSLGFMHDQLLGFDVGAFLSDDIHLQVDRSLLAYELFLNEIGYSLTDLFADNIFLMHDIHAEYTFFLHDLRADTFTAQAVEQEALQEAIVEFAYARGISSDDTVERLGAFAAMMPASRVSAGINHSLVDFTVAPFDFVFPALQDDVILAHTLTEPVVDTFRVHQMVALAGVGGVFVITLGSLVVAQVRRKKKML